MPELTVGLIGCGSIAKSAHVPALLRLSALVRVLSVCDIRPAVAEQVAHTLGAAWTSDYHQLLEDPRIDAVVITTPEFLHAEQAIAALEMGKHVLCEKPIARTLAEADAMIAAAEAAGVQLMIAHSRRFTARYRRAHELLASGTIGEPVLVRENERRPRLAGPGVPQSGWQPDPDKATTWYAQARYAAGTTFHIGVHEMDLLRWFAGAEAHSIYMESKMVDPQQEVPDTVTIQIRFENDVLGACDIFTNAPAGYPNHHELEEVMRERMQTFFAAWRFRSELSRDHALPQLLDYLSALCPETPRRISAMQHRDQPIVIVTLRYPSDVLGSIEVGGHLPRSFPTESELAVECFCETSAFMCEPGHQAVEVYGAEHGAHAWQPEPADAIVTACAAWLRGGARLPGSIANDVANRRLVGRISRALQTGAVLE